MLKYEKNGKTYTCTLYSQIHADEFVKSPAATKKYLEYVRAAGQDVILLTHCEFFAVGEERVRSLETVKRACAAALAAGFRPIVWTSTLGYGGFRDEAFRTRFPKLTRLMNFDGHEDGPVCTTDPVFTAAIQENVRDYIRAGARAILLDDDFVQSVRPGFTCTCPNHLALLEKKLGKKYTREQVRDFFTGAPSPERTAFIDVMGESMMDFCRALRSAADEVDPSVSLGICCSFTHHDEEGVDLMELSRLLCAEGQKPFLRFSGAPYWAAFAPKFRGQTVTDVADFVRLQAGWYRGRDITLFDENDCFPRDHFMVPVATCELYDKIVIANGGVNRHKYILCFDVSSDDPELSYLQAHLDNVADDEILFSMFADKMPVGYRVFQSEHLLRRATLGDTYAGNGEMMNKFALPFAAGSLTDNSIPVRFEGGGVPGICYGCSAMDLTEEDMKNGVILDAPAAQALLRRGIDVGVSVAPADWKPRWENYANGRKLTCGFVASDTDFYALTPAEGAETVSTYPVNGAEMPAVVYYESRQGYRFVIQAFDGTTVTPGFWGSASMVACPSRQQMYADLYERLSGKRLPVFSPNHPGLYLLCADDAEAKRRSVLMCVDGPDALCRAALRLEGKWRLVRSLRTDAVMSEDGRSVTVEKVPAYDWAAVELERVE